MNKYEQLYEEFKKGWKVRVVENEHLLNVCFLEFLSTVNKVRYIYGGQYKSVNLSSFKIQQSGTGKGVGDRYVHDILRYCGYKVCKINSFTEAAIIGSLQNDIKGKASVIKGALGEYDFIWIDEARNLIVGNQWSQGLLESINGYLDEGFVFKRLARGEIKYFSKCNFATGTFFFSKLKPTVLTTGLFQRCLFSYKNYNKDDIIRISNKYDELACKSYISDLEPVFSSIKTQIDMMNFEKYNIAHGGHKNYVIKMDMESSRHFGQSIDNFFNNEIFEQVKDERLKNILASFLIRGKELGHKIMCLYAVVNEKDHIDIDCAKFTIPFIKRQMRYVLEFVSDVFESTKFDSDDLTKEEVKRKNILTTKRMVIKTLRDKPGITKGQLREIIQKNRHMFHLGELQIVRFLIPTMIADNQLTLEQGDKPAEKRLFVAED